MIHFLRSLALATALINVAATPAGAATRWEAEENPAAISWEGLQGGNVFTGHCRIFDAAIVFDPSDLMHSSVKVTIDMGACITGDQQKDSYLPQEGWFGVADFPKAIFEATRFLHQGGDKYIADGTLTLKGVTKKVELPFTLDIKGDTAHAVGETTLQRLAFGVGAGDQLSSADVAGPDVKVKIDLTATRKK